jgi:glycosyltransferase involved in cell wall biosynthesis
LQPTNCEGFGLAIVEAQACGLPVITTMEPCVFEVNAESVLYSDNIADMVCNMKKLLTDEKYWSLRSEQSLNNAIRYSYSKRNDVIEKMLIEENILESGC